jgi:hypothetical protein
MIKQFIGFLLLASALAFGQGGVIGKNGILGRSGIVGAQTVLGPSYVQSANATSGSGFPNLTPTLGVGTTAGNAIVVYGTWLASAAPTPAASNVTVAGSTCSVLDSVTDGADTANALYLCTGVTTGTTTATLNLTSDATMNAVTSSANAAIIFEIHNTTVKDGSTHAANTAGTTATNGEVCGSGFTTTHGSDLIIFAITDRQSFGSTTWTAGTSPISFTIPTNGQVSNKLMAVEYGTQSSAGAITPAITANTTDNYDAVCAGLH